MGRVGAVADKGRARASGTKGSARTAAERRDAERLRAYRRARRLLRVGQVLMGSGAVIALVHWLGHVGAFGGQPSNLADLLAGYPAAALVFVAGAILAGQRTY